VQRDMKDSRMLLYLSVTDLLELGEHLSLGIHVGLFGLLDTCFEFVGSLVSVGFNLDECFQERSL
jgi:hypothetical protein